MPLSATSEPGHCELHSNNVYFFMMCGGHRIRCGITNVALEVLDPKLDRTRNGWLVAFNNHRAFIERMVSAKFDNNGWERDGITIIVGDVDVEHR